MHSCSLKQGQVEKNEVEQDLLEVDGTEFTHTLESLNLYKVQRASLLLYLQINKFTDMAD